MIKYTSTWTFAGRPPQEAREKPSVQAEIPSLGQQQCCPQAMKFMNFDFEFTLRWMDYEHRQSIYRFACAGLSRFTLDDTDVDLLSIYFSALEQYDESVPHVLF